MVWSRWVSLLVGIATFGLASHADQTFYVYRWGPVSLHEPILRLAGFPTNGDHSRDLHHGGNTGTLNQAVTDMMIRIADNGGTWAAGPGVYTATSPLETMSYGGDLLVLRITIPDGYTIPSVEASVLSRRIAEARRSGDWSAVPSISQLSPSWYVFSRPDPAVRVEARPPSPEDAQRIWDMNKGSNSAALVFLARIARQLNEPATQLSPSVINLFQRILFDPALGYGYLSDPALTVFHDLSNAREVLEAYQRVMPNDPRTATLIEKYFRLRPLSSPLVAAEVIMLNRLASQPNHGFWQRLANERPSARFAVLQQIVRAYNAHTGAVSMDPLKQILFDGLRALAGDANLSADERFSALEFFNTTVRRARALAPNTHAAEATWLAERYRAIVSGSGEALSDRLLALNRYRGLHDDRVITVSPTTPTPAELEGPLLRDAQAYLAAETEPSRRQEVLVQLARSGIADASVLRLLVEAVERAIDNAARVDNVSSQRARGGLIQEILKRDHSRPEVLALLRRVLAQDHESVGNAVADWITRNHPNSDSLRQLLRENLTRAGRVVIPNLIALLAMGGADALTRIPEALASPELTPGQRDVLLLELRSRPKNDPQLAGTLRQVLAQPGTRTLVAAVAAELLLQIEPQAGKTAVNEWIERVRRGDFQALSDLAISSNSYIAARAQSARQPTCFESAASFVGTYWPLGAIAGAGIGAGTLMVGVATDFEYFGLRESSKIRDCKARGGLPELGKVGSKQRMEACRCPNGEKLWSYEKTTCAELVGKQQKAEERHRIRISGLRVALEDAKRTVETQRRRLDDAGVSLNTNIRRQLSDTDWEVYWLLQQHRDPSSVSEVRAEISERDLRNIQDRLRELEPVIDAAVATEARNRSGPGQREQ